MSSDATRTATNVPTGSRRARRIPPPVSVWAAFGITALIAQAVILGRWLAAGNIHAAPRDYDISTYRMVITWIEQGAVAVGAIAVTIYLVYQCRRAGQVTFWAIIAWGNWFTWWLGPLMVYNGLSPIANRYALNVVSWGPYFPGWNPPRGDAHIETFFAAQMLMYPLIALWVWGQLYLVNLVSQRYPHWSVRRMLPVFFLTGLIADLIVEILFVPITAAYGYPIANQELSLFGGHWYQLPLLNVLVGSLAVATPATVMLWISQRRGTIVHIFRGSEDLRPRVQATMRIFAGIGLANAAMLVYACLVGLIPLLGMDPPPPDTPGWIWPT